MRVESRFTFKTNRCNTIFIRSVLGPFFATLRVRPAKRQIIEEGAVHGVFNPLQYFKCIVRVHPSHTIVRYRHAFGFLVSPAPYLRRSPSVSWYGRGRRNNPDRQFFVCLSVWAINSLMAA